MQEKNEGLEVTDEWACGRREGFNRLETHSTILAKKNLQLEYETKMGLGNRNGRYIDSPKSLRTKLATDKP
jgi:hypothetical protein